VFSKRLKESLLMAGSLRLSDNQFHSAGPATEKARRPQLLRRWRGTTRRPRLAERRCCLEATLETTGSSWRIATTATVIVHQHLWQVSYSCRFSSC